MENPKKMKRKREEGPDQSDVKVQNDSAKKHCLNTTKSLKENNHTHLDSKSDTASKKQRLKPNSENDTESKTGRYTKRKRERDRRKRNKKVFKKHRKMENLKSDANVTEKGKVHVKTDSIHLKTGERHFEIPSQPEDFSSNWEKLKQKVLLTPQKSRKRTAKKRVEIVKPEKPPDIWFDDVDESLLDIQPRKHVLKKKKRDPKSLVKEGTSSGLTKAVALDCEFVGVGADSKQDMLARISLVNQFGHCIYDTFVKPQEKVTDYRTWVSGVREKDMLNGVEFSLACKKAAEMIKGRILVGHAIKNDLKVLYLTHPKKLIRDTSKYKPFRAMFDGKTPSLKKLTAKVLDVPVQEGEHSSIQDAQATMRLYTMYKQKWEKDLILQNPWRLKQLKSLKDLQNGPGDENS